MKIRKQIKFEQAEFRLKHGCFVSSVDESVTFVRCVNRSRGVAVYDSEAIDKPLVAPPPDLYSDNS